MNKITKHLVIEDEEATRLAETLAARTGRSVADAVKSSLRAELERTPEPVQGDDDTAERIRKVLEITDRFAASLTPEQKAAILDESWMYDEHGLPR